MLIGWLLIDGLLIHTIAALVQFSSSYLSSTLVRSNDDSMETLTKIVATDVRAWILSSLLMLAGVAFVGIVLGLLYGRTQQRGMRAWLGLTALFAAWLFIGLQWEAIAWTGKSIRLGNYVKPSLNRFVSKLQSEWPQSDGILPELGPFLAYPIQKPSILLLLNEVQLPETDLKITAIEYTEDRSLRFELAGAERGSWLEFRCDSSIPQSFVGGLEQELKLKRFNRVAQNWFVVQYQSL